MKFRFSKYDKYVWPVSVGSSALIGFWGIGTIYAAFAFGILGVLLMALLTVVSQEYTDGV